LLLAVTKPVRCGLPAGLEHACRRLMHHVCSRDVAPVLRDTQRPPPVWPCKKMPLYERVQERVGVTPARYHHRRMCTHGCHCTSCVWGGAEQALWGGVGHLDCVGFVCIG